MEDPASVVETTLKALLFNSTQTRLGVLLPQINAVGASIAIILGIVGAVACEYWLILRRVQISISYLLCENGGVSSLLSEGISS